MLRIRLARRGKKRQPSYRVVVAESSYKRDGRFVEQIGYYNPMVNPIEYKVQEERALHWLNVGAQPSDAVRRLLEKQGTYDRLTRLRGGEAMGKLVAEFEGTTWPPVVEAVEEAVSDATETVSEEAEGVLESLQEAVSGAAAAVSETVSDVVETISETVENLVERITGDDDAEESADDAEQSAEA
jgi:small subunit ribosomal protein S16